MIQSDCDTDEALGLEEMGGRQRQELKRFQLRTMGALLGHLGEGPDTLLVQGGWRLYTAKLPERREVHPGGESWDTGICLSSTTLG